MISLSYFRKQDRRSKKMYLNILLSFLAKGWGGVVQLLLVPLTLLCLSNYEYGIWLTVSSVLMWIDTFDIGLGNGLRNKLAEFVAKEDWEKSQQAVSTSFYTLASIIIPVAIILITALPACDIYGWLNVEQTKVPHLVGILQVCVAFVCATFVFKIIGNVYLALQMPAINNVIAVLAQTLSLIIIAILSVIKSEDSFLWVSVAYTACPLLVYLIAFPITFKYRYTRLRPRIDRVRRTMLGELFSLGLEFFAIQIFGIILFTTSNLIISHVLGPEEVAPYQIAYRYFSLALMIFTIIIAPIWSATTEANVKKDMQWIKASYRKMLCVLAGMAIIVGVMIAVSFYIFPLWTLGKVEISFRLTFCMGIYFMLLMTSLLYAHFLYGFGTIRLQTIVTGLEAIAFLPLAIYGVETYRVLGIIMALIIVNLACTVSNFIQFHKLLNGTATGIWVK